MFLKIGNDVVNIGKKENIISYMIVESGNQPLYNPGLYNSVTGLSPIPQPVTPYTFSIIIKYGNNKEFRSDDFQLDKIEKIFETLNVIFDVVDIDKIDPVTYKRKKKLDNLNKKE
jgi:hypothetical protein